MVCFLFENYSDSGSDSFLSFFYKCLYWVRSKMGNHGWSVLVLLLKLHQFLSLWTPKAYSHVQLVDSVFWVASAKHHTCASTYLQKIFDFVTQIVGALVGGSYSHLPWWIAPGLSSVMEGRGLWVHRHQLCLFCFCYGEKWSQHVIKNHPLPSH